MTDPNHTAIAVVFGLALLTLIGWLSGAISRQVADRMNQWLQRFGQRMGALSSIGALLLFLLALVWLVLFGVTVVATFGGVLALQADPGSGGLGLGTVLIGLLGAPFLIWATVIKQTALNFQKEGHITDRISKAVEQLGAEKTVKVRGKDAKDNDITIEESKPNIEVRIGGILSLERIAQDSTRYDRGRDHVRVMEILCAYVRENGRAESLEPTKPKTPLKKPRLDLQVAMTAIKRRSAAQLALEAKERYRLDLQGVDFGGMDLSNGDLSAALMQECRFGGTSFQDTNLSGARFDRSLLNFVLWWRATLTGVSFNFCVLNQPEPVAGGMVEASPSMGNARGVSVIGADLTAMDYFGEKPDAFFGSKDTKIHHHLDDERDRANSTAKQLHSAKYHKDITKVAELEASLSNNPFKHWAPYDSTDGATGLLLSKWRQNLGLTDWPYIG
jgi:uncharacterized protein YjbI with pentapeptide repeats